MRLSDTAKDISFTTLRLSHVADWPDSPGKRSVVASIEARLVTLRQYEEGLHAKS